MIELNFTKKKFLKRKMRKQGITAVVIKRVIRNKAYNSYFKHNQEQFVLLHV